MGLSLGATPAPIGHRKILCVYHWRSIDFYRRFRIRILKNLRRLTDKVDSTAGSFLGHCFLLNKVGRGQGLCRSGDRRFGRAPCFAPFVTDFTVTLESFEGAERLGPRRDGEDHRGDGRR